MKYTGILSVTPRQVGDQVYFVEHDLPLKAAIVETQSIVYKNAVGATVEVIEYRLAGQGNKWFPSTELFSSAAAIKTDFGTLVDGA